MLVGFPSHVNADRPFGGAGNRVATESNDVSSMVSRGLEPRPRAADLHGEVVTTVICANSASDHVKYRRPPHMRTQPAARRRRDRLASTPSGCHAEFSLPPRNTSKSARFHSTAATPCCRGITSTLRPCEQGLWSRTRAASCRCARGHAYVCEGRAHAERRPAPTGSPGMHQPIRSEC